MNGFASLAEKIPFAATLPYAIPVAFVEIAAGTCSIKRYPCQKLHLQHRVPMHPSWDGPRVD